MRAADMWESARFSSLFLALSFFLAPQPSPRPPTSTPQGHNASRWANHDKYPMQPEEDIAKKYLEQQRLGSLVFEPDGNIPPDFSLSQRRAIEVRRLNRTLSADGTLTEENTYIPFWNRLKKVSSTFDGQDNDKSYLIIIDYIAPRPLPKFNEKQISQKLKFFLDSHDSNLPYILTLNDGLSLRILELEPIKGHTFTLASWGYDIRSVSNLYIDSVQWCIEEKSNKIKPHKHKYLEWQLLLVDSMRWDLGIEEVERIRASITDLGLFDSLIVIDYDAKLLFRK